MSGTGHPGPVGPAPPAGPDPVASPAAALVDALTRRGLTVAVAESLTGGAVAAALVDVPGASRVLRGGVVAYAADLKATLLDVDPELLARSGPVHPDVAAQMARGVRARLGADVGLATTGVAGPGGQDGHPAGEVHVAVATDDAVRVESLRLVGDRDAVRRGARDAALRCALQAAQGVGPAGTPTWVSALGEVCRTHDR